MTFPTDEIAHLERVSARAWPAARVWTLGGWRLHATSGHSGRINACWPLGSPGLAWPEALARTEAWYQSQGLRCLFKIVEAACAPSDLAARLADSGYRPRSETIMMLGRASVGADEGAMVSDAVETAFADVLAATEADPGEAQERLETLGRIPSPRAFARIDVDGRPAAIGAAAVEGEWVGIFAMRTDAAHRRKGLAARVLSSLLARANRQGASRAWLQVEADNPGAIALYARAGFVEAYRYRYWHRPEDALTAA